METQGYFGKTPEARDFVFHGLPMKVTDLWAEQMAQWLAVSRQLAGAHWQRHYLGSPVWRFLLPKGVLGAQAWLGLFASSIDSVGREFPFTLMMTVEIEPQTGAPSEAFDDLLDPAETLMLAFMEGQIRAEELRDGLQTVAKAVRLAGYGQRGAALHLDAAETAVCAVTSEPPARVSLAGPAASQPLSTWWSEGTGRRPPAVCVSRGLLPAYSGGLFFLDDWASHWVAQTHAAGRA